MKKDLADDGTRQETRGDGRWQQQRRRYVPKQVQVQPGVHARTHCTADQAWWAPVLHNGSTLTALCCQTVAQSQASTPVKRTRWFSRTWRSVGDETDSLGAADNATPSLAWSTDTLAPRPTGVFPATPCSTCWTCAVIATARVCRRSFGSVSLSTASVNVLGCLSWGEQKCPRVRGLGGKIREWLCSRGR